MPSFIPLSRVLAVYFECGLLWSYKGVRNKETGWFKLCAWFDACCSFTCLVLWVELEIAHHVVFSQMYQEVPVSWESAGRWGVCLWEVLFFCGPEKATAMLTFFRVSTGWRAWGGLLERMVEKKVRLDHERPEYQDSYPTLITQVLRSHWRRICIESYVSWCSF